MDSAVTRPHPGHLSWQIVVSDAARDICINTTSVSVAPIYGCLPSMFYASSVQPGRATPNEAPFLRRCTIVGIDSISRPRQRVEHAYLQDRANPDVVGVAADLARRLGRFDQAIEFAQYLLQLDPLDAVAYEDLAYAYRYAGKLDEALDALRTVLRLSPHYFMAHEGIGELLLQKGDAEAALAEMQLEKSEPARLLGSSMALHALDVLNLRTSA